MSNVRGVRDRLADARSRARVRAAEQIILTRRAVRAVVAVIGGTFVLTIALGTVGLHALQNERTDRQQVDRESDRRIAGISRRVIEVERQPSPELVRRFARNIRLCSQNRACQRALEGALRSRSPQRAATQQQPGDPRTRSAPNRGRTRGRASKPDSPRTEPPRRNASPPSTATPQTQGPQNGGSSGAQPQHGAPPQEQPSMPPPQPSTPPLINIPPIDLDGPGLLPSLPGVTVG